MTSTMELSAPAQEPTQITLKVTQSRHHQSRGLSLANGKAARSMAATLTGVLKPHLFYHFDSNFRGLKCQNITILPAYVYPGVTRQKVGKETSKNETEAKGSQEECLWSVYFVMFVLYLLSNDIFCLLVIDSAL